MDQSRAPVLEALSRYRREGQLPFTPPGHKQARGADPEVREVLGDAVFASDVLAISGLDDRHASNGVLREAEGLMAEAVRAEHTFFSTCGSSLSVKAAMLAVAGPYEKLAGGPGRAQVRGLRAHPLRLAPCLGRAGVRRRTAPRAPAVAGRAVMSLFLLLGTVGCVAGMPLAARLFYALLRRQIIFLDGRERTEPGRVLRDPRPARGDRRGRRRRAVLAADGPGVRRRPRRAGPRRRVRQGGKY